ncbi:hypothetical protein L7F22_038288 [Adiantum nelumboides]|nr:hypothetical protein [Adiantum nelumboides]
MNVDEVSDYIDRECDRGAQLVGTWIPLLLSADDIVLISDLPEYMQQHLDALHSFAKDSGLSANLGKTKVMLLNSGSGDQHLLSHMEEEELVSAWWKEYAECSEGPLGASKKEKQTSSEQDKDGEGSLNSIRETSSHAIDAELYESDEVIGVSVKGGLYEVDLYRRRCFPVYWTGDHRRVLRGHWFAQKGGLDWLPLREDVSEQLEFAYRSQIWHRRTFQPSGKFAARVNLQSPIEGLHALFTGEDDTWEAWLGVDLSGISSVLGFRGNGFQLRRGFAPSQSPQPTQDELRQRKEEAMDDYCSQVPVGHLVFMVHGIGQRLEKANLIDDVGTFRHTVTLLAEQHLTSHQRNSLRVLFIPCQWRRGLKLGGEEAVENCTLEGVRALRTMLSATVHDVLYYMSPVYCQDIIDSVSGQLNMLYLKFIKRNPGYVGKIMEALKTVVHICNRSPHCALDSGIPEEVWSGKPASYDHLKVFGCECYVHVPVDLRTKLDMKSLKDIFLGYGDEGEMGYRVWIPGSHKVIGSRDVVFNEPKLLKNATSSDLDKKKVKFQHDQSLPQPFSTENSAPFNAGHEGQHVIIEPDDNGQQGDAEIQPEGQNQHAENQLQQPENQLQQDQVNDVTFRLDLPTSWKIHNAFRVSLLRPYVGSPPSEPVTEELPEIEEVEEILEPEQIVHHQERHLKFGKIIGNSAYHPQTDGQTERVNQILEEMLRHYIQIHLASLEEYLPLVEFAYNNAPHSITGMTPFQAAYGHTPLVPTNFFRNRPINIDDMQNSMKLKQYIQGDSPVPELSSYVPEIEEHVILVPEMILDVRQKETRRKLTTEFLVKWMDLDESDSTWQTDEEMQQYPNLLQEFFDKRQSFI